MDLTLVTVAAIAAIPGVMAAWNTRPNGRGPIRKMLADIQDRQGVQEIHMRDMIRWQVDHQLDHMN